jgi:hypothetical protein
MNYLQGSVFVEPEADAVAIAHTFLRVRERHYFSPSPRSTVGGAPFAFT